MTREEEIVVVAGMAATLAASGGRAGAPPEQIAADAWELLEAVKKAMPPAAPSKYGINAT